MIGGIQVSLGMPQEEVFSKLSMYNVEHRETMWYVRRRSDGYVIGSLLFDAEGQLRWADRVWDDSTSELVALYQAVSGMDGNGVWSACAVAAHQFESQRGPVYGLDIECGPYRRISISGWRFGRATVQEIVRYPN